MNNKQKILFCMVLFAPWLVSGKLRKNRDERPLHEEAAHENNKIKMTNAVDNGEVTKVPVDAIREPQSIDELYMIVREAKKPIAIMGARYSQGGQTAYPGGTVIDMRHFNKVINFNVAHKIITVQAGMTWCEVQKYIDPYNLSVSVMQSYNDFSVGGSLSVNVHGRFVAQGSIVETVESMRIMLADGSIVTASRDDKFDLFSAVIGGYGACGIIIDVTLRLTENIKMERRTNVLDFRDYSTFFNSNILHNADVVMHNADLYPDKFDRVHSITWYKTDKAVTVPDRLRVSQSFFPLEKAKHTLLISFPLVRITRALFEPVKVALDNEVVWRNYEMSHTVKSLKLPTHFFSVSILQEYFVPVDQLENFIDGFKKIVKEYKINVLNASLRYVHKNSESLLAYAPNDSFACVLYINIHNANQSRNYAQFWTRRLIDCALVCGGTYYLPYQSHATLQQLLAAYPRYDEFLAIKNKYDPTTVFSNSLFKQYAQGT